MQDNLFTLTFQHGWKTTEAFGPGALAGGSCQTEGHRTSSWCPSGSYHLLRLRKPPTCGRDCQTGILQTFRRTWPCEQGHERDGIRNTAGAEKGRVYQVHFYPRPVLAFGYCHRLRLCVYLCVWIGLDLFNDDTRPSGHISRPTQVNVSQNCFHSLNNYSSPIILYSLGASWSQQITSYQIEESRFSQEFHYAGLRNCLEESIQRVNCVIFITTFL